MFGEGIPTDQLSTVISHAIAPSFLLGAVAGFMSILNSRMSSILDRVRSLNAIAPGDADRGHLKADIPRLERAHAMARHAAQALRPNQRMPRDQKIRLILKRWLQARGGIIGHAVVSDKIFQQGRLVFFLVLKPGHADFKPRQPRLGLLAADGFRQRGIQELIAHGIERGGNQSLALAL